MDTSLAKFLEYPVRCTIFRQKLGSVYSNSENFVRNFLDPLNIGCGINREFRTESIFDWFCNAAVRRSIYLVMSDSLKRLFRMSKTTIYLIF